MNGLDERVASLEAKAENFEAWQKTQNGCLLRLEGKLDKIYMWLIGLMGGISMSLVLLVFNLVAKK